MDGGLTLGRFVLGDLLPSAVLPAQGRKDSGAAWLAAEKAGHVLLSPEGSSRIFVAPGDPGGAGWGKGVHISLLSGGFAH